MRSYGISGLQKYIRRHIELAKRFEQHVLKDKRFEICNQVKVSGRIRNPTEQLLSIDQNKLKAGAFPNLKSKEGPKFECKCSVILKNY